MQHVYANDTYQDPVWVARFTLYKLSASQCMFLLFFCICAACFSISLFVIHGFTVSPNSDKMVAMTKGWQLQLHNFKLSIWTWLKPCKIMQNQRDLVHMSELFAGKEFMQPFGSPQVYPHTLGLNQMTSTRTQLTLWMLAALRFRCFSCEMESHKCPQKWDPASKATKILKVPCYQPWSPPLSKLEANPISKCRNHSVEGIAWAVLHHQLEPGLEGLGKQPFCLQVTKSQVKEQVHPVVRGPRIPLVMFNVFEGFFLGAKAKNLKNALTSFMYPSVIKHDNGDSPIYRWFSHCYTSM